MRKKGSSDGRDPGKFKLKSVCSFVCRFDSCPLTAVSAVLELIASESMV